MLGSVSIPCHSKTVHIEEAVAHLHESVFGVVEVVLFSMREEQGQVVLGALLGDGVCGID